MNVIFKEQIQKLIIFWEIELEDCIAEGKEQHSEFDKVKDIIKKLKSILPNFKEVE